MLNAPVQASANLTECLTNYWKSKQERTKRKDQPWRRLATLNKIAQKSGYNLPTYHEKKTIAELLNQYGEYSYLTGKPLGNYYLSTLDLDLRKEEFPKQRRKRLEKNSTCLLNFLHTSYDKTKKGLHIDILTPEPLSNENIYWIDKLNKKWTIGSIQSLGKYVVGEDPKKLFIKNGKWYWKVNRNEEVKTTLNQFFFYLNNQEKKSQQLSPNETIKTVRYQAWDYNLNKQVEREYSLIVEKPPPQSTSFLKSPTKRFTIQAKILSKWKTHLENIWKIFYLNSQGHKDYFLWNHYQHKNFNLDIGESRNILLIKGRRHNFFSRVW